MAEDEDASELRLGDEFKDVPCLSHLEVLQRLEVTKKIHEDLDKPFNNIFVETYSYVKRFSEATGDAVSATSQIKSLRETLESKTFDKVVELGEMEQTKLHPFEIASLLNMSLEETEEAYALIPSLQQTIQKDDLAEVLEMIAKAKDRSAFA